MRWTWFLMMAACGGSSATVPDAPAVVTIDAPVDVAPDADPIDLACLGQPADPPATTAVHGTVVAIVDYEVATVPGATVELRRTTDDSLVGQVATDRNGAFAFPVAAAVAGYFVVTSPGSLVTRVTSDTPLDGDTDALLLVADSAEVARWYGDAGAVHAAGARTAIVGVRDCQGAVVANARLDAGGAAVTYYDDVAKRWDPALTASTNGFVLLPNAPAKVTITPRLGTTTFPAGALAPIADQLTLAIVSPYASR